MSSQDPIVPSPTPQEWLSPARLSTPEYVPAPPSTAAFFELRPLTLGEILDRTFTVYRSRFLLFAGIAAFAGVFQALMLVGQLLIQARMLRGAGAGAPPDFHVTDLIGVGIMLISLLCYMVVINITTAAVVFAVSEIYLGRPASIGQSLRVALQHWFRYIMIAVWQYLSGVWPFFAACLAGMTLIFLGRSSSTFAVAGGILLVVGMIGSFVVGYILYLRNMLGVPASVTEKLPLRASMRRSKNLSKGAKGRIFVLHLVFLALAMVVSMLQIPFSMVAAFAILAHHSWGLIFQALSVIVAAGGRTVIEPVLSIGLTLIYFDQRVRHEAFDLAVLMGEDQAVGTGVANPAAAMQPPPYGQNWAYAQPQDGTYSQPPAYGYPTYPQQGTDQSAYVPQAGTETEVPGAPSSIPEGEPPRQTGDDSQH